MSFKFGQFDYFCEKAALPLCNALKLADPDCYSRNVDFNGFLLFQPSVVALHFAAIVMTTIMIYHIKSKYTAVGRKEMVMFFYSYLAVVLLEFLLITNIISAASSVYGFFTALQLGFINVCFWLLMLNGFVGFQWAEDGTRFSVWSFRLSSAVVLLISFIISLGTFKGFMGMSPESSGALFFMYFIFNGLALIVYLFLQIFLVINTLEDRWPLGDLFFGILFFMASFVVIHFTGSIVCSLAQHYVDGLFFGTLFSLLAVMMVYKYWDSITKEDLEFSVGVMNYSWDIKNEKQ